MLLGALLDTSFPDMVAIFQSVILKEIKEQLLLTEGRKYRII